MACSSCQQLDGLLKIKYYQNEKSKPKKTIEPILDNSSAGKFKRLPKKSTPGDYWMKSVSKFHK